MPDRHKQIEIGKPGSAGSPARPEAAPGIQGLGTRVSGTLAPGTNETFYETMDRIAHANLARATSGLAPSVLAEAWADWAVHLGVSPGKQMQLMESAMRNAQAFWSQLLGAAPDSGHPDAPPDRRFADEAWDRYPFNVLWQAHLRNGQWHLRGDDTALVDGEFHVRA